MYVYVWDYINDDRYNNSFILVRLVYRAWRFQIFVAPNKMLSVYNHK